MASKKIDENGGAPVSAATKLRGLLEGSDKMVVCPGVYDGFSARIALSVGFDALYMVCSYGAGTSASRLGHADLGITALHDMRDNAEMIANLDPNVPLIADADTGYGGPINVARTVQEYIRSGVAGLHLEDQVQTKRCGHLGGKELVDRDTYLSRIRAATAARKRLHSDIVIIARTDALQSFGYEESITRLRLAQEAGADVGFLEGVTSKDQAQQAVRELAPFPLLLNMVEHGATPTMSVEEAQAIGFRIMIFPFAAIAGAYTAMKTSLEKLKKDGLTGTQKEMTPHKLFSICGLEESVKLDAEAGGKAYAKDL